MEDPGLDDGGPPPPKAVGEFLDALARSLDQILNGKEVLEDKSLRKNGFILLIFPYGENDGRANYVSNGARREDIIKMFEVQIERLRQQEKERAEKERAENGRAGPT